MFVFSVEQDNVSLWPGVIFFFLDPELEPLGQLSEEFRHLSVLLIGGSNPLKVSKLSIGSKLFNDCGAEHFESADGLFTMFLKVFFEFIKCFTKGKSAFINNASCCCGTSRELCPSR